MCGLGMNLISERLTAVITRELINTKYIEIRKPISSYLVSMTTHFMLYASFR